MMKISVLASGSKGNSTLIVAGEYKILIDLGTSSLYVERKLKELGINPAEITHILITHSHVDHVGGLKVFTKKYNPVVYISEKIYSELEFRLNNYVYIDEMIENNNQNLNIQKFNTSHDVLESFGYIIEFENKSVVYVTDTGYINNRHTKILANKSVYIIESNHDPEMLMDSKRPHHIKMRILGDKGHLSNDDCANYLKKFVGEDTKHIILAHLSEEANNPKLAYETTKSVINNEKCNIIIANQHDKTELIEI